MTQRLLVEGDNDIHVIANLAKVRKLPQILGYEEERRFKEEFVVVAGNRDKLLKRIPLISEEDGLQNFGIVLDADSSATSTWQAVRRVLEKSGYKDLPIEPVDSGFSMENEKASKVGVWIMPDNTSAGYLEHFVANLIPEEDNLSPIVKASIQSLFDQKINRFSEVKRQKAEIHTWLAWQADPGLPMGTAMNAKYFNAKTDLADRFIEWLGKVFNFAV